MDVEISPARLRGAASAPPSKSYTHRAFLAAGYAEGATVTDPLWSADTLATAGAVEAFGGSVLRVGREGTASNPDVDASAGPDGGRAAEPDERGDAEPDEWGDAGPDERGDAGPDHAEIGGFAGRPDVPEDVIDCANSGTTMRLTTATAALADGLCVLTGDGSLRSRPQGPLLDAIEQLGGRAESTRGDGQAPLVVGGPIEGGTASIPGDVSSQFVTALLMAGAVTESGIAVDLETELKSAPYVDVTIEVLADFGVEAHETADGYAVEGGQQYAPAGGTYAVPGDFSSMSYLLAAGALAAPEGLRVEGARPSAQGDSAIVGILERMGADLAWDREAGEIEVAQSSLSGIEVGVADTPDLLPTIATLGAAAEGTTRIVDAEHVRYKETDRVAAMAEELTRLGAEVTEREDELHVHGGESELVGATVDGRADHRVIMSLAVAGLVAEGSTTITGAEHVDVSFPEFFEVLAGLGAEVRQAD